MRAGTIIAIILFGMLMGGAAQIVFGRRGGHRLGHRRVSGLVGSFIGGLVLSLDAGMAPIWPSGGSSARSAARSSTAAWRWYERQSRQTPRRRSPPAAELGRVSARTRNPPSPGRPSPKHRRPARRPTRRDELGDEGPEQQRCYWDPFRLRAGGRLDAGRLRCGDIEHVRGEAVDIDDLLVGQLPVLEDVADVGTADRVVLDLVLDGVVG